MLGIRGEKDMEVTELKKQIKENKLDSIYIFHGEEHEVMKTYLREMSKRCGLELSYVDSVFTLASQARAKSLIPTHHLYVIVDDKDYLTNDKLWEKFKGLKDDVVVFYYTSTDLRLKFWKNFKDRAVEFKTLDNKSLYKYIEKEIGNQSKTVMQELIDVCEGDYGRILLELDKVKQYTRATGIVENCVLENFLYDGTIYRPPKDAIFEFVGAFLARDPARAFNLLEQSYAVGEANMVLLSVMYSNVRNLLIYQSAKSGDRTTLSGWEKKNVSPFKNNYSNGELVRALKLIREAESGIKKGLIQDEMSVQSVLVKVM